MDMFQYIFGKKDVFVWSDLEIISEDSGTQFTSMEFQDEYQNCSVHLKLAARDHQKMNGQVKVKWRMLHITAHSLMVHARVSEYYIYFSFMYTEDHILLVLPIKYLINEDRNMTTSFKLATGTKPSVSHLRVLFFPCVVRKASAHVGKKALNMCHQAQRDSRSILVGITQHQRGYTVYVPHRRKKISSYVFF